MCIRDRPWSGAGSGIQTNALGALEALIGERLEARAAARKARDFAAADLIRTQLGAAGVAVEDTTSGARWSLVRPVDGER